MHVRGCAISNCGKFLVSSSYDHTLRIWDTECGICKHILSGHTADVNTCALSHDGKMIVSGSDDCVALIWDTLTGKCTKTLSHSDRVYGCAISLDSKIIVSSSTDGFICIWDISDERNQKPSPLIRIPTAGSAWSCDISSDKTFIACAHGCSVSLFNTNTGEYLKHFEGHDGTVTCCKISSDGRYVVSCSYDKTVRLWDILTGTCVMVFNEHTDLIYSVAIATFLEGSLWPKIHERLPSILQESIEHILICINHLIVLPKELKLKVIHEILNITFTQHKRMIQKQTNK
eukprot:TRINITY_DN16049_c0_g1_i1.p1 TRINITY_DN16049_c0_g1~~TRINITY_DN16049_c0_g1_i1.p1  ORF type:complete len:288 (+),score=19.34 TRINITY_DN16049_c0_g1_i1:47-910(+)